MSASAVRALFATLAWALCALGCGERAPADARAQLVLWHSYRGAEEAALLAALRRFEATRPDLRVRAVSIPYDAFPNKLGVAVPRGNGPDLFVFAHDRVGDWAETGIIEPIGFWADEALIDRFFRTTVSPLVYRGQLYGLPLAFKTLALYYDPGLVPAPPATTDDLVAAAKAARAADPQVWGLGYEVDSLYFHAPWLHGFGGAVYADEDDTVALDSPASAASLAFVRRLLVEEKIIPEEATSALVTALFNDHHLAFVISGPWFKGELAGNDRWAVAPLPTVSETGQPARPFLGVEAVLMSGHSRQKRSAFALMTFLTTDAEAAHRLLEGSQLVANQAPYDDPRAREDAFLRAFRGQVEHSVSLSNRPHMRRVWTPMKTALSQAIVHGQDPLEALRDAAATIQRATE